MKTEKEKNQSGIFENIEGASKGLEANFGVEENQAELEFQAFRKKKDFKKRALKMVGAAFVFVMILGASLAVYFRNKNIQQTSVPTSAQVQVEIPKDQDYVIANDVSGVSTGKVVKEDAFVNVADDPKGLAGKSENYLIKDIAIGGGNIVLASGNESLPLKVSDVHSETLMSKDGKKTQLLLSWKTNKLAKSEVKYSKDGKGTERSIKEDGYGFSHALVLSSLEQSTRYLFTVSASDRGGNTAASGALAVFTGNKPVSVFELIAAQFGDMFGWAMKK